jgi:membrane-associated protein
MTLSHAARRVVTGAVVSAARVLSTRRVPPLHVITAGVVAAAGDLSLAMIVAAAAAGAFLDDKTAYWIGRRFGRRVVDHFFSSEKSRRRIEWAEGQLTGRGRELIAIARFIPGGRRPSL